MTICDDGHEEIVFVNNWMQCPLCESLKRIGELEMENDELQDKIDELEEERWLELAERFERIREHCRTREDCTECQISEKDCKTLSKPKYRIEYLTNEEIAVKIQTIMEE